MNEIQIAILASSLVGTKMGIDVALHMMKVKGYVNADQTFSESNILELSKIIENCDECFLWKETHHLSEISGEFLCEECL